MHKRIDATALADAAAMDGKNSSEQTDPSKPTAPVCEENKNKKKMSQIMEMLECPVCLDYPRGGPIFNCSNGHIICCVCKPGVKGMCPTCRDTKITFNSFVKRLADRALKDIRKACKFSMHGCTKEDLPEHMTGHEERCQYRDVHCPAKHRGACEWVGSLSKMVLHIRDQACIQVI